MIPKNLIPEGLRWCIAGGYAACPALAADTDVWVMVDTDIFSTYDRLRDHFVRIFGANALIDPRPDEAQDMAIHELYVDEATIKVAHVSVDGRDFHIMVTYCASPMAIIDRFDISTHQVALTSDGGIIRGQQWTAPHVYPVRLKSTPRTELRMRKICARYGHQYQEGR